MVVVDMWSLLEYLFADRTPVILRPPHPYHVIKGQPKLVLQMVSAATFTTLRKDTFANSRTAIIDSRQFPLSMLVLRTITVLFVLF